MDCGCVVVEVVGTCNVVGETIGTCHVVGEPVGTCHVAVEGVYIELVVGEDTGTICMIGEDKASGCVVDGFAGSSHMLCEAKCDRGGVIGEVVVIVVVVVTIRVFFDVLGKLDVAVVAEVIGSERSVREDKGNAFMVCETRGRGCAIVEVDGPHRVLLCVVEVDDTIRLCVEALGKIFLLVDGLG